MPAVARCAVAFAFILSGARALIHSARTEPPVIEERRRFAPADPACTHYGACLEGTVPLRASEERARSVRVLCHVICSVKRRRNCALIARTWGQRCDKLVFSADFDDPSIGAVDVKAQWEGEKSVIRNKWARGWLPIIAAHADAYDWFVKADDDTLFLADNLRRYAAATAQRMGASEPRYLGLRYKHFGKESTTFNAGAAYALNRPALRLVGCMLASNISRGDAPTDQKCEVARGVWRAQDRAAFTPARRGCVKGWHEAICRCEWWVRRPFEDVNMAVCMRIWGVVPEDTRDDLSRERFWITAPWFVYSPHGRYKGGFDRDWSYNSSSAACGCERVAAHPIAFHSLKKTERMERAYCQIYGRAAAPTMAETCSQYIEEPPEKFPPALLGGVRLVGPMTAGGPRAPPIDPPRRQRAPMQRAERSSTASSTAVAVSERKWRRRHQLMLQRRAG